MKRTVVIASAAFVLLVGQWAFGGVSLVMNGSFENNDWVSDITSEAPQYWCDVNMPANKFGGFVSTDWQSHNSYSLGIYAEQGVLMVASDEGYVSQRVYLADVNEIIFDLQLTSSDPSYDPWDPEKRSALVRIDDIVVWDSNDFAPNIYGEYLDQRVYIGDVNGIHDANLHTLSLVLRAISGSTDSTQYAQWDFVKFDTHCGGFGYLPEDFDKDCFVDINDLAALTDQWLDEQPDYLFDLFEDAGETINFSDYAVFADSWLFNSFWENRDDNNCYEAELLSSDLNNDGIVDMRDYAVLAGNWAAEGDCIEGDIDCSGSVDYDDFSEMAEQWLLRSWLYDLEI